MDNSRMLNGRLMVFIIFIGIIVHNATHVKAECNITSGFDIEKMDGEWNYVAGIYPESVDVKCGRLTVKKISEHRLKGYVVVSVDGNSRQLSFQAFVSDNMAGVRYLENGILSSEYLCMMKTCDGKSEFSLEIPRDGRYFIFSKSTTVSQEYLGYYETLSSKIGSNLRIGDNKECSDVPNLK